MKKLIISSLLCLGSVFLLSAQSPQRGERPAPRSAEEVLADLDANKDGQLSKAEVKGPLAKDFDTMDANKDGFLNKAELENKPPKPARARKEPPSAEQILVDLDANKDGQLSKEEVRGPLAKDFDTIDSNKNGFLSKEELEQMPPPRKKRRQ